MKDPLDIVRKLVALAASDKKGEAEAAAMKACALIREHGFDVVTGTKPLPTAARPAPPASAPRHSAAPPVTPSHEAFDFEALFKKEKAEKAKRAYKAGFDFGVRVDLGSPVDIGICGRCGRTIHAGAPDGLCDPCWRIARTASPMATCSRCGASVSAFSVGLYGRKPLCDYCARITTPPWRSDPFVSDPFPVPTFTVDPFHATHVTFTIPCAGGCGAQVDAEKPDAYCPACRSKPAPPTDPFDAFVKCADCGKPTTKPRIPGLPLTARCDACLKKSPMLEPCARCGKPSTARADLGWAVGVYVCGDCYDEFRRREDAAEAEREARRKKKMEADVRAAKVAGAAAAAKASTDHMRTVFETLAAEYEKTSPAAAAAARAIGDYLKKGSW